MINLQLQPNELDYIAQLLARQPWNEVNALLVNLKQQVEAQNARTTSPDGPTPHLAVAGGGG